MSGTAPAVGDAAPAADPAEPGTAPAHLARDAAGRLPRTRFLGLDLTTPDLPQAVEAIEAACTQRDPGGPMTVTFLNPNYVMEARRDAGLAELVNRFDVVLADGWGIVYGARLLGATVPDRVANDDLTEPLFARLAGRRTRVFLFGSAPGVADAAAALLTREFPGLQVVGTQHGWLDVERGHPGRFDPEDVDRVVAAVNESDADLLVVGVPTPLQQQFVCNQRDRLRVGAVITGGSWLDHLTEDVQWYPRWVVRARLCWLFRLAQEPRRLWRRYSIELLQYGSVVLRARIAAGRRRGP